MMTDSKVTDWRDVHIETVKMFAPVSNLWDFHYVS